jgi:signal transduction histidine kinase
MSMRWWLALSFAAIAALTALSVAAVFSRQAHHALRDQGQNLAVGQTSSAAHSLSVALAAGAGPAEIEGLVQRFRFAFWVFGPDGKPVTHEVSRGARFENVPEAPTTLRRTLEHGRVVLELNKGESYLVGLPLRDRRGAVVAYIRRPELETQLGIVHDQIVRAALLAIAIGALIGLLVATLITARLRRIARAAAAIEAGAFDTPLRPRFRDELGALADTIDQMRVRLRASFGDLEAERDRLHQLLEGLQEGVIALDSDFRIVFANGAARSLFGEAVLTKGRPVPEPWLGFPLQTFAGGLFGASAPLEARVEADGRTFALTGIPARPGTVDAILVVADVTERERRERAEREFVTNAAHELGTPLTAIRASLDVLQGGAKQDDEERDYFLALIDRQTHRLSRLRRGLLALARAQTRHEPLQLEGILLTDTLQRVADEVESGDVAVTVQADPDAAAFAHPELLEQILVNLVENALRHAEATEIELVAGIRDSGLVWIEVRDNGKGITATDRDRIFDRFYRAGESENGDGFGLGLAIVREAVRAVGGTIRINPRPGGGTVAVIVLAAAEVPVR